MTKQSFKDETDINVIVERFGITGELPNDVRAPQYQDFTSVYDYHSALNAIAQAREAFDQMPAQVRAKFHNDTEEFVVFCNDPANLPEMKKLGLTHPSYTGEPKSGLPQDEQGTQRTGRTGTPNPSNNSAEPRPTEPNRTTKGGTSKSAQGDTE